MLYHLCFNSFMAYRLSMSCRPELRNNQFCVVFEIFIFNIHPQNYEHALPFVMFRCGWLVINPFIHLRLCSELSQRMLWLPLWHMDNLAIIPSPVKQSWGVWKFTRICWYYRNQIKQSKIMSIFYGVYYFYLWSCQNRVILTKATGVDRLLSDFVLLSYTRKPIAYEPTGLFWCLF